MARAVARRSLLAGLGTLAAPPAVAATPLRLLVLADIQAAPGALVAMRMAAEEFGGGRIGRTVDIVSADPGGDGVRAAGMVERWIAEDDVAAVVVLEDGPGALAAQAVCRARQRILLFCGPSGLALSGPGCDGGSFMWTGDDRAIGRAIAAHLAVSGQRSCRVMAGGAEAQAAAVRTALAEQGIGEDMAGVAVLCGVGPLPPGPPGIAARLNQAALADAVGWLTVAPFAWSSVPSAGEAALAWVRRFLQRAGRLPEIGDIGAYEAVRHVLGVVAASGGGAAGLARQMRYTPVNSPFTRGAQIGRDGRVQRPMRLLRVLPPAERRAGWDVFAELRAVAPEAAGSVCPA